MRLGFIAAQVSTSPGINSNKRGSSPIVRGRPIHEFYVLHFLFVTGHAMVIHAAAELGCDVVWTEDLNDGQVIRGVHIRDPFMAEPS